MSPMVIIGVRNTNFCQFVSYIFIVWSITSNLFLKQGFNKYPWLVLSSLNRADWTQTQKSTWLCPL